MFSVKSACRRVSMCRTPDPAEQPALHHLQGGSSKHCCTLALAEVAQSRADWASQGLRQTSPGKQGLA